MRKKISIQTVFGFPLIIDNLAILLLSHSSFIKELIIQGDLFLQMHVHACFYGDLLQLECFP